MSLFLVKKCTKQIWIVREFCACFAWSCNGRRTVEWLSVSDVSSVTRWRGLTVWEESAMLCGKMPLHLPMPYPVLPYTFPLHSVYLPFSYCPIRLSSFHCIYPVLKYWPGKSYKKPIGMSVPTPELFNQSQIVCMSFFPYRFPALAQLGVWWWLYPAWSGSFHNEPCEVWWQGMIEMGLYSQGTKIIHVLCELWKCIPDVLCEMGQWMKVLCI